MTPSDYNRRYRNLIERFCALDPQQPEFAREFIKLKNSAEATMHQLNTGRRGHPKNMEIARSFASDKRKREAKLYRAQFMPYINQLRAEGKTSLREIANGLNEMGVKPRIAKLWTGSSVNRLLQGVSN